MALAARGQQGRIWRLDTEAGPIAVKELTMRQTAVAAAADVAYQEAALATGAVPMPRPLLTADGQVLCEVAGHQFRAYAWVELLPADPHLDPVVVGATLAAVHQVRYEPASPLHSWYVDPVGAARWAVLLGAARAVGAPFAEAFDRSVPELVALEALMEPPTELRNCHRDLWADNLLPTPDGGVCVIDWENCGLEDPAQEIPMVLFDFGLGDPARVAALYQAYVDAGGSARITRRDHFTMVIAQFGHFWESAVAAYCAPGAGEQVKQHSLGRVAELLERPFRVAELEELLDTVTGIG